MLASVFPGLDTYNKFPNRTAILEGIIHELHFALKSPLQILFFSSICTPRQRASTLVTELARITCEGARNSHTCAEDLKSACNRVAARVPAACRQATCWPTFLGTCACWLAYCAAGSRGQACTRARDAT